MDVNAEMAQAEADDIAAAAVFLGSPKIHATTGKYYNIFIYILAIDIRIYNIQYACIYIYIYTPLSASVIYGSRRCA